MAYFEPDGQLYLIGNLDIGDQITYLFSSAEKQREFFMKHVVATFDDMSYMSHDGIISIESAPATIKNVSYLMFRNPTQEDKWWYARVLSWKWINSATTTEIMYEIDWFQSYMFDYNFSICEIERETPSEEGWQKALVNPYDNSVLEMGTSEPVSIGDEDMTIPQKIVTGDLASGQYITWPKPDAGYKMYIVLVMANGWISDLTDAEKKNFDDTLSSTKGESKYYDWMNGFPNAIGFYSWTVTLGGYPEPAKPSIKPFIDLLTLWGVTSEIIGIYYVPDVVYNSISYEYNAQKIKVPASVNSLHPKLSRFPFRFIKISNPDGAAKELKFEHFADLRLDINNGAVLECGGNMNGLPLMYIMPENYDYSYSANMGERIEYANFPQIGYNTDAYLTFLNQSYNSAVQSNNSSMQLKREMMTSDWYKSAAEVGALAGTIGGTVKGIGSMIWSGSNPADSMLAPMYNLAQEGETQKVIDEATKYRSEAPSAAGTSALEYAKPAYLADNYIPGGSSGYLPYSTGKDIPTFLISVSEITPTYQKQVATFLKRYGCSSGRIGIPYCSNYANIHWDEFRDANVTYCQTKRCEISCNNTIARRYIESMFNKGVLFVKGE